MLCWIAYIAQFVLVIFPVLPEPQDFDLIDKIKWDRNCSRSTVHKLSLEVLLNYLFKQKGTN